MTLTIVKARWLSVRIAPTAMAVLVLILLPANTVRAQPWIGPDGNNNIYYNSGNVGIGTSSPDAPLHIGNGPTMTGGWNRSVIVHASYPVVSFNSAATKWGGVGYDYSTGMWFWVNASSNDVTSSGTAAMTIQNSGKIGIGTVSPTEKLEVQDGFIGTYHSSAAVGAGYAITSYTNTTGSTKNSIGVFGVVQSTANTRRGDFVINLANDGAPAEVLRINRLGYLGIGTTGPDAPLHVGNGPTMSAGWNRTMNLHATFPVVVFNSAASKWAGIGYDYSSAMRFWVNANSSDVPGAGLNALTILNNGNVGIGADPTAHLDVVSTGSSADLKVRDGSRTTTLTSNFTGGIPGVGTVTNSKFAIATNSSLALTVDTSQNVGIGTTDPGGYKLNVNGNANITGNINLTGTINAKYQDVAEWVPSSEQPLAGTVVVLDSTKSNQVISSSISYDTRVAGVISERPGLALGEKSDGKVLVATTGRVRVKVDASKGPISIGDLLVTSDVPGMAMKSEPIMIGGRQIHGPGTLIGKALEPLEKGSGTILVLLSLQ